MKKALILGLALALIAGVGVFAVGKKITAQTGPEITYINTILSQPNEIYVQWHTNITTTGLVEYGTTSGNYTDTLESNNSGTYHSITLSNLDYETMYYYRIKAIDLQNNVTYSNEYSLATSSQNLCFESFTVIDKGPNKAYAIAMLNKPATGNLKYGTSPDDLNLPSENIIRAVYSFSGQQNHPYIITGLNPNTTYYIQATANREEFAHGENESIESDIISFTTTGIPSITSINPDQGVAGTEITISGSNFGSQPQYWFNGGVGIGCNPSPSAGSSCNTLADLISWSDSTIVVRTNDNSETGPVYVYKVYDIIGNYADFYSIQGPEFRVVGEGGQAAPNTNTVPPAQNYVTNAYGCNFSTSIQDDNTIKVNTLFTNGGTTDSYLEQVYNLYNSNWGRYPRCSEMQFHLDHSTPIDRLTSWLQQETIKEKYDCKYSTTLSDDSTVRVKSMFTLNSDTDKYLNDVYNAYYDNWGRYPRCDELQFHLDHSTPLSRLTSWLQENRPVATNTNISIPTTSTEVTGTKIEFEDSGTKVELKDKTQKLAFEADKEITFTGKTTPHSVVTLEIASQEPMIVTTRSNDDGYWFYTLPGPLSVGDHTVKVSVTDAEGNKVSESDTINFSIIATAKAATTTGIAETTGITPTTWIIIVVAAIIIIILVTLIAKKKSDSPEQK